MFKYFADELNKIAGITPPVTQVFRQVKKQLPPGVQLASGGLEDARGISDVDIALLHTKPSTLLSQLPAGTTVEHRDKTHSIYTVPGYERDVNLYVTSKSGVERGGFARGIAHRQTALALEHKYPDLAAQARQYKQEGMGTEPAWGKVLNLQDPYEDMLDKRKVLRAAAQADAMPKQSKNPDKVLSTGLITIGTDRPFGGMEKAIRDAAAKYESKKERGSRGEPLHVRYGPDVHYGVGTHGTHLGLRTPSGDTAHLYRNRIYTGDSKKGTTVRLSPAEQQRADQLIRELRRT